MLADKLQLTDDAAMTRIARVEDEAGVKELFGVLRREQSKMQELQDNEGATCDEKTFRFRAGRLSLIRELLELPAKAKKIQQTGVD